MVISIAQSKRVRIPNVFDRIRELASVLGIRDGALVRLARDIAHDGNLRDLEYMSEADALELALFLERAMQHRPKRELVMA